LRDVYFFTFSYDVCSRRTGKRKHSTCPALVPPDQFSFDGFEERLDGGVLRFPLLLIDTLEPFWRRTFG